MLFSKIIKKKFDEVLGRYDGSNACYYFSPSDFKGVHSESYDIKGQNDITLKGYLYYYDTASTCRIVIFDHGIGAGHLAYFKEIEQLIKHGYTVYSYDHTGCVASGGEGIYGFAQGINDLDKVISTLKKDNRFKDASISIVGHSWGGYSAMNVVALHPEVTHVVSLAGFLSARSLIEQYIPKMFLKYSEEVMERERIHNPRYADMVATESLKKSDAKLLYIQSKDDLKVRYELGYIPLYDKLKNRKNTTFISVDNRNHEPHHTDKAVKIYKEFMDKFNLLNKKKKLNAKEEQDKFRNEQDWNGMTEQDSVIWNKIFDFLDN